MYFVIAAGGTAGHINPALALAEELTERGHEILFIGTSGKLETRIVPEAGFKLKEVEASGFRRARPLSLISSSLKVLKSSRVVQQEFERKKPDATIGFGAYVETPLALAARRMKVPYAVHEQNSVPGMANLQTARWAKLVAVSYPHTVSVFEPRVPRGSKVVFTGNPVRHSVLSATRQEGRELLGIDDSKVVMSVMGGSLGAKRINDAILESIEALLGEFSQLEVVHSIGSHDFERVTKAAESLFQTPEKESAKNRWHRYEYINDMGKVLAASDMVLSRAGASSIAEISALKTPALLVPYPYARGDHQTLNARFLADSGGALMVSNEDLTGEWVQDAVENLMGEKSALADMKKALSKLESQNSASKLADEIELRVDN